MPASKVASPAAASCDSRPDIRSSDTILPGVGTSGVKEWPAPTQRSGVPICAASRSSRASSASSPGVASACAAQLCRPLQLRQR
ncbi:hypothetical protein ABH312_21605 [Chromobacterium piscinae]